MSPESAPVTRLRRATGAFTSPRFCKLVNIFEAAKDEIDAAAAETARRKAARAVLTWAERAMIAIRPGVTEPFVVRGSFHMLADETPPRLGWHPDFQDRLATLLNQSSAVPADDAKRGNEK